MILKISDEDMSGHNANLSSSSRRSVRLLMNQHNGGGTNTDGSAIGFDVIHSGVPTRTTSTLTPTTLRNIEQTFLEMSEAIAPAEAQIPHQAGFVPPMAPFPHFQTAQQNQNSSSAEDDHDDDTNLSSMRQLNSSMLNDDDSNSMDSESMSNCSWQTGQTTETPPPASTSGRGQSAKAADEKKTPKRNRGGRRPNKPSNLTPEEEEKRQVRRERNKLAAARCRKRRVDHTNELIGEVEGLENKKKNLQSDIQQLQQQKEELEFLLDAHRDQCRMFGRAASPLDIKPQFNQILSFADKIKSEPIDFELGGLPPVSASSKKSSSGELFTPTTPLLNNNPLMSSSAIPTSRNTTNSSGESSNNAKVSFTQRPNRPSSLAVPLTMTPAQSLAVSKGDFTGIPISTPSNGIFNFDSLMDGGTGLTPVAAPLVPNSAPHNRNPLDLVTPTSEPAKLVSL